MKGGVHSAKLIKIYPVFYSTGEHRRIFRSFRGLVDHTRAKVRDLTFEGRRGPNYQFSDAGCVHRQLFKPPKQLHKVTVCKCGICSMLHFSQEPKKSIKYVSIPNMFVLHSSSHFIIGNAKQQRLVKTSTTVRKSSIFQIRAPLKNVTRENMRLKWCVYVYSKKH